MVLEESPEGAHNKDTHPDMDSESDVFHVNSFPFKTTKGPDPYSL